jgi:hypothetical protein
VPDRLVVVVIRDAVGPEGDDDRGAQLGHERGQLLDEGLRIGAGAPAVGQAEELVLLDAEEAERLSELVLLLRASRVM